MIAPSSPPNKKRLRMDLTLPVNGKEKSPTKRFLKRIGSSFRSPFSPKTVDQPQQVADDFYSDEVDYAEDVDQQPDEAVTEKQFQDPHLSFEEARVEFLPKRNSLLNHPDRFASSMVIPLANMKTFPGHICIPICPQLKKQLNPPLTEFPSSRTIKSSGLSE